MIGGEFVLTGDGLLILTAVFALIGLAVGWMGGRAEGRDKELERLLPIHREMRADFDSERQRRLDAEALMRLSARVVNIQLQTIKELEAQLAANPSHSQGTER